MTFFVGFFQCFVLALEVCKLLMRAFEKHCTLFIKMPVPFKRKNLPNEFNFFPSTFCVTRIEFHRQGFH